MPEGIDGYPVIGNDTVYAKHDDRITAVEVDDGDRRWTWLSPDVSRLTQPLPVDNRVYVAGGGHLWALEAATGKVLYDVPTGDEVVNAAPLLYGTGRLYMPTSALAGSRLVAFDAASGAKLWESERYTLQSSYDAELVFANGQVIVGHDATGDLGNRVTSFDAATGQQLWAGFSLTGPGGEGLSMCPGPPIGVADGVLVVQQCEGIFGIDLATRNQLWVTTPEQFETVTDSGNAQSDILLTGNVVHVLTHPTRADQLRLTAIDVHTGQTISTTDIPTGEVTTASELAEAPRYLTAAGDTIVAWFSDAKTLAAFRTDAI